MYDLERTPGGSSGGSGASLSANLGAVAIGQEGLASIRRPSAWSSIVGMRPTLGLVSRTGAYGCWPSKSGSLGPMARTVEDAARLLDVIVGYDPEDPSTAHGVGKLSTSFVEALDPEALRGARIGIIRETIGLGSDPAADDFAKVRTVFGGAVAELAAAGAEIVDPVQIKDLHALLAKRSFDSGKEAFENWMGRNANPPYKSFEEFVSQPQFKKAMWLRGGGRPSPWTASYEEYLEARQELMTNLLVLMADEDLDAIVHVTVEHTPTLIEEGIIPPYHNMKGAPHLNTFLYEVPSLTVPAGFTDDVLPVGITFLGRPYSDLDMIRFGYAYEQATKHRVAPTTTPA